MFTVHSQWGELRLISGTPGPQELPDGPKHWENLYRTYAQYLKRSEDLVLHERIYAHERISEELLQIRHRMLEDCGVNLEVLPTFVQGTPLGEGGLAGLHAMGISRSSLVGTTPVESNGMTVGVKALCRDAEYLYLSDVSRLFEAGSLSAAVETQRAFATLQELIEAEDWSIGDIKRTWFYLKDILTWYDDFNQVRNSAFRDFGFLGNDQTIIPASTGIMGANLRGNSCTLDVLAMRPVADRLFRVSRLLNPKQNEAPEYGSAFSRGLKIELADHALILVSGTASIDECGRTVFPDDAHQQISRTLENVQALLASGGASRGQLAQATVFVKREEDYPIFEQVANTFGFDASVCVPMIADVCRDDLLFEIDATAILPT